MYRFILIFYIIYVLLYGVYAVQHTSYSNILVPTYTNTQENALKKTKNEGQFFPVLGQFIFSGDYTKENLRNWTLNMDGISPIYGSQVFVVFLKATYALADFQSSWLSTGFFLRYQLFTDAVIGLHINYEINNVVLNSLQRIAYRLEGRIPNGYFSFNYYEPFYDIVWKDPNKLVTVTWLTPLMDMGVGYRFKDYFQIGPLLSVNHAEDPKVLLGGEMHLSYEYHPYRVFLEIKGLLDQQNKLDTRVSLGLQINLWKRSKKNFNAKLYYVNNDDHSFLYQFPTITLTQHGRTYLQPSLQIENPEVADKLLKNTFQLKNISLSVLRDKFALQSIILNLLQ